MLMVADRPSLPPVAALELLAYGCRLTAYDCAVIRHIVEHISLALKERRMKRFGLFISTALTTTAVAGVVYSGVKMKDIGEREAALAAQKNELETEKTANAKADANAASSFVKRHQEASLIRQEIEIEIATSQEALAAENLKLDEIKRTERALEAHKQGLVVEIDALEAEALSLKAQNKEADSALNKLLARKEELRLEIEDRSDTNNRLEAVAAKLGTDNLEAQARLEEAKAGLEEAKTGLEEARLQAKDQRAASAAKQAQNTQRARNFLAEAGAAAGEIVRRAREIEEEAETKLSDANTHKALTSSSELQLSELHVELEKNAAALKAQNKAMSREHTVQIGHLKAEHQLEIEQMQKEIIREADVKHQHTLNGIQAQLFDSRRQQEVAANEIAQLKSENSQFRAQQAELDRHMHESVRFERENIGLRATNEALQQQGTTILRQAQAQAHTISEYERLFNETRDGTSSKRQHR